MNLQVKLVGFEIGGIQMHLLNIFLDNFFPPTKIALIPSEFIEIIAELADMQIFRVLGCLAFEIIPFQRAYINPPKMPIQTSAGVQLNPFIKFACLREMANPFSA
jgi:hypothetical protein